MSDLEIYNQVIKEDVDDDVVKIKDATSRSGQLTPAYSMGYKVFDDAMSGGVREGELVVITGLSGHGKSTVSQNISINLSDNGHPCLWFSYEMILDNIYAKFKEMGVDEETFKIYTPKRNTSGNTDWISKKIKEGVEKYGTRFIFIDHLDYLVPSSKNGSGEAYRHFVGNIVKELTSMAIDLRVTIFLLAHVKKVPVGRGVEMQDLAESGEIYKLATYVFSVARNVTVQVLGGVKTESFGSCSNLRILKNRITGQQAVMEFRLENSRIVPLNNTLEPREVYKENREIEIEELNFNV